VRAAYFNQAINLLVSILMVPLLLKFLGLGEYILWAIFTTFGGITLQIESSIQALSVREIAKQYQAGNQEGMRYAIKRARRAYRMLSLGVLIPFTTLGLVYLSYVADHKISQHWKFEWLIFAATYALNYYFGVNSSVLLALGKVSALNHVQALTRLANFLITFALLWEGLSVMGVCLSFAISVLASCALIAYTARSALLDHRSSPLIATPIQNSTNHAHAYDIARHTLFTFAAFALYKGSVLVAASFFTKEAVGAYSLTLQAFTMLTTLALVPIQVWLSRLVNAILMDNTVGLTRELARTIVFTNLMFVAGTAVLLLLGNQLLALIGSSVTLPQPGALLLVGGAFLIEMNLLVLINLLVTKRRYDFVRIYLACAATGAGLMIIGLLLARDLFMSMVFLPMAVQLAFCLPKVLKLVCEELKTTPHAFAVSLWRNALARN